MLVIVIITYNNKAQRSLATSINLWLVYNWYWSPAGGWGCFGRQSTERVRERPPRVHWRWWVSQSCQRLSGTEEGRGEVEEQRKESACKRTASSLMSQAAESAWIPPDVASHWKPLGGLVETEANLKSEQRGRHKVGTSWDFREGNLGREYRDTSFNWTEVSCLGWVLTVEVACAG